MLDTTLTIAAGVSTEEAVKRLKLNETTLKKLGAKKVSGTSLGSPTGIESIRVHQVGKGDSTDSKIITMIMTDSPTPITYHRLSGDSTKVDFKKHVIVRGSGSIDGKVFSIQHPKVIFKSSENIDSLLKGRVIYSRDSTFNLSADSIFRHSIKIERLEGTDEVRVYNFREEGDTTTLALGDFERIKINASKGKGIIILRSIRQVEPVIKKKGKKDSKKEADPVLDLNVQIYPNPTSGTIKLAFQVEKNANTKIRIVNSQGNAVFQEEKEKFRGQYSREVDLAKYGSGLYVIQIMVGKTVQAEKVLVH